MRRIFALSVVPLAATSLTACFPAAGVPTYTVTSVADTADRTTDGICADANGVCTLRAALAEADRDGGASSILFDIAGTGPHTIQIGSPLPTLTQGTTSIDGYSQSGASPNTSTVGSTAQLKVQIRGTGSTGPEALVMTSGGNVVRGLAFFNLRQGIRMTGAGAVDNVVAGNFIGTNTAATFSAAPLNSNAYGIVVTLGASRNRVGGTEVADRNVISGNAGRGVLLCSPEQCTASTGANDNVVEDNIVGLTPNGGARLSNLGHGIDINAGSSRNRVTGNVVSGNGGSGIEVSHGTSTVDNLISNNKIGTSIDGASGPPYARNNQPNIRLEDGVRGTVVTGNVIGNSATGGIKVNSLNREVSLTRISANRIGVSTTGTIISNGPYGIQLERGSTLTTTGTVDTVIGPDNVITGNGTGIRLIDSGTVRNTITGNSIYGNDGLGIDIEPLASVNQNDLGDADTGPNEKQNFPELIVVTTVSVTGTACAGCRVEIFQADTTSTDPSLTTSYGEGRRFLASGTADAASQFTIALPSGSSGSVITSTATDTVGNTSEFSANKLVP